ncbi:MAG: 23S rRNA (guanosine(2251)-2'-O)-methyltransferase RlmB [Actinomycetota bacterium]|nr:23S rRNA (guanosine(2251)-2'-O)-methyltransferase RlmB [Actinomycetota bacterium]
MRDEAAPVLAGRRPVLELLRAGQSAERIFIAKGHAPSNLINEIRRRADRAGVPLKIVPSSEIERLAGDINHQGVIALTARYRYTPLETLLAGESPALLFLDGVTDPHNLGSLLRSADGAGFSGVVIPARRTVQVTAAVRRVSAGAAEVVPVARVHNLSQALEAAREAGLWILGLDGEAEEDVWSSDLAAPPVGLVVGSEDKGMGAKTKEGCDALVRIPQRGRLESLNVAVAGAIAMYACMPGSRADAGTNPGLSEPAGVR